MKLIFGNRISVSRIWILRHCYRALWAWRWRHLDYITCTEAQNLHGRNISSSLSKWFSTLVLVWDPLSSVRRPQNVIDMAFSTNRISFWCNTHIPAFSCSVLDVGLCVAGPSFWTVSCPLKTCCTTQTLWADKEYNVQERLYELYLRDGSLGLVKHILFFECGF